MDEREVRSAWEKFVARGVAPAGMRTAVAASWRRSRAHHVPVESKMAPLLAEAELFRHRSKHASLLHAARPALASSSAFLSDANSIMILTDPCGVIIDTQGDPRVIDAGRSNHLEHGGRWAEADIGTNAIGTAMAEARPVQIHAAEHFCEDIQRWTCAAAPVRHPLDGEILGVVDISGPACTFSPQSLAFAVSVSQHVEGMLAQATKCDHEQLLAPLSLETIAVAERGDHRARPPRRDRPRNRRRARAGAAQSSRHDRRRGHSQPEGRALCALGGQDRRNGSPMSARNWWRMRRPTSAPLSCFTPARALANADKAVKQGKSGVAHARDRP